MIDNIFQIGTAAEAQRAGTAQDSSAYPSVDHQWIMAGLQRVGLLPSLFSSLGALYKVKFTTV